MKIENSQIDKGEMKHYTVNGVSYGNLFDSIVVVAQFFLYNANV